MQHFSDAQVRELLPSPAESIDLMREALIALANGEGSVVPKTQVTHDVGGDTADGFANAMPASWPERGLLGIKWVTITPSNPPQGRPMTGGIMVLSDGATGANRCTMDAGELTALRTAAVTGATLALDDRPITFIGAGVQARSHARVIDALAARDREQGRTARGPLTLWARRTEALTEFEQWATEHVPDLEIRTTTDRAAAVRDAGVIVSGLPIGLRGSELDPAEIQADATLLPLDYASVAGRAVAQRASLAADDPEQFETLRAMKLGTDYPQATAYTGEWLQKGRPDGLVVVQNLGSAMGDLLIADAVARAAGV
ncbi:ornithine cyclodeaminase [Helcobacillus massiliensis]|uniref:ornithine cyclodeaminase n=1 Tax=Helcobacillus TaxID=1161125 RepID=UPI001EF50791|nr:MULTISPECIES: ornithine cyclodeaminase [Helcobacillus]MCG7427090.1 ornithine cyclodeaminase [Helcobacillus sp. ACRRO]MCT1557795.1 ornithine cyclodeaminase [Helcobacillus massiliensis]MCT2036967.1 ornithine cyclodeaminase [Helcobacillus massiliensis]MCT2332180.1 ornithine cyclodeaminase [Helcobacillus massiliensis]MDK7742969.1 ornithine cyclodeaminase [Helcobacillus massiliensis]